jgi:hypothetical protein
MKRSPLFYLALAILMAACTKSTLTEESAITPLAEVAKAKSKAALFNDILFSKTTCFRKVWCTTSSTTAFM